VYPVIRRVRRGRSDGKSVTRSSTLSPGSRHCPSRRTCRPERVTRRTENGRAPSRFRTYNERVHGPSAPTKHRRWSEPVRTIFGVGSRAVMIQTVYARGNRPGKSKKITRANLHTPPRTVRNSLHASLAVRRIPSRNRDNSLTSAQGPRRTDGRMLLAAFLARCRGNIRWTERRWRANGRRERNGGWKKHGGPIDKRNEANFGTRPRTTMGIIKNVRECKHRFRARLFTEPDVRYPGPWYRRNTYRLIVVIIPFVTVRF